MIVKAAAAAAVGIIMATSNSCEVEDPCEKLDKGTSEEVSMVKKGIEMERTVDGQDCVLGEDGVWEQEAE